MPAHAVEEGIRLFGERRLADARRVLEAAVAADRRHVGAWTNLGLACEALGDYEAARAALRTAAGLDPDDHETQHGLGLVALRVGDFERSEAYFRNAIRLHAHPGYYNNLSLVLRHLGRSDESDAAIRKAVELAPHDAMLHSNLILYLNYAHGDDGARIRAEADAWARRHAAEKRGRGNFPELDRTPSRRLRVGYVSPDFRLHAVAFFFEPLLMAHDRSQMEVFCYSDARVPDDVTRRLRGLADVWREAHTMSDDALERAMLDDRIDVAVDLAGHTGGNRLPLFARRVAPVQVSYLGYLGTTGVPAMDYRFTDAIADPPGRTEPFSSEQLVRLEGGMFVYEGNCAVEVPPEPPVTRTGGITFGSFNPLTKITEATLHRWSAVLAGVPASRLLIKAASLGAAAQRETLWRRAVAAGMDPERLVLLGPEEQVAQHLARYNEVDIAVDTYPYNSITTAFEALWMGVPLVTRAGPTQISRFAASTLTHIGLEDLIVATEEAYVERAITLARDMDRLRELRRTLRGRMAASSLCDSSRLARGVESAYRDMWARWCAEGRA